MAQTTFFILVAVIVTTLVLVALALAWYKLRILKKKNSGKLKSLNFIGNLPKIEDVEEKPQAENSKLEDIEHLEKVGETKDVILP